MSEPTGPVLVKKREKKKHFNPETNSKNYQPQEHIQIFVPRGIPHNKEATHKESAASDYFHGCDRETIEFDASSP